MRDKEDRSRRDAPSRQTTQRRVALGVLLLSLAAALTVGVSACGGGSPQTSGVANLGTTTSTTAKAHPSAIKFSECMRAHGITKFPDPTPTGNIEFNVNSGIPTGSPQFRAAQQACMKYNPVRPGSHARLSGPAKAVLLEYAKCMRAHGVANFPDPVAFGGGQWGFNLVGQVDQTSPSFQAANEACKSHAFGGIHPCGGTGGSRRSSSQERRC